MYVQESSSQSYIFLASTIILFIYGMWDNGWSYINGIRTNHAIWVIGAFISCMVFGLIAHLYFIDNYINHNRCKGIFLIIIWAFILIIISSYLPELVFFYSMNWYLRIMLVIIIIYDSYHIHKCLKRMR